MMFTKPLEYIITTKSLLEAYEHIKTKSSGLDDVTLLEFEKDLSKNIATLLESIVMGTYAPEPIKKIEIEKQDSTKKRPIGLSAIKDKILQKVLYNNLNPYFDKLFSEFSYAYRADKSTLKAINRTTDFLNRKNFIVVKSDIENFFETIDHDILLKKLNDAIKDKQIIRLLSLFIQIGGFSKYDYDEHLHGVYQGDILSPLLSNIYLDAMDKYLEKNDVKFIRYADDFVMLFDGKNEAYKMLKELKKFLKTLKLKLSYEKTSVVHIKDGFTFLGIEFYGKNRAVQEKRLEKSLLKLENMSKTKLGFYKYVDELNSYLYGLKNYYLKVLTKNSTQYMVLQQAFINSLSHKVYLAKKQKTVTTKKEFKILLEQVHLSVLFEVDTIKDEILPFQSKLKYNSDEKNMQLQGTKSQGLLVASRICNEVKCMFFSSSFG